MTDNNFNQRDTLEKIKTNFSGRNILIIDDDRDYADSTADLLNLANYKTHVAYNETQALQIIKKNSIDIALIDIRLGQVSGTTIIPKLKEVKVGIHCIMVTGFAAIESAMQALKNGAYDYLRKPVDNNELLTVLNRCLEKIKLEEEKKQAQNDLMEALSELNILKNQLQAENIYLREEIKLNNNFEEIIGESKHLQNVLSNVEKVAHTESSVLILGETGTGKELIARSVHYLSNRKEKPLVKVNCAVLPANLIESELFGHEKGAFTGAVAKKLGRFELADNGTIFLDEIGELPLELQGKLLRVLQEGEFERIGSEKTVKINVRVIAATNRDLEKLIIENKFRSDLFYRLNVFPLKIPALRERKEDIPQLVSHFVDKFSKKLGKNIKTITNKTLEQFKDYSWPGNIRELENIVERAMIFSKNSELQVTISDFQTAEKDKNNKLTNPATLEEMERSYIIKVLDTTNWVIAGDKGAASILGLHYNTLRSRMDKLGIKKSARN
jgi:DNA-binding NtrC family response regulator